MSESTSALKTTITEDMKSAMRAKDTQRLGVIRLILAAIKQKEVDERIVLDDAMIIVILDKMVKQRRDSIQQYEAAGRADLADVEKYEITLIQHYLPTPLSELELTQLINQAIEAVNAGSVQDMGKVMAQLKPQVQGRADMGLVSKIIKERLA